MICGHQPLGVARLSVGKTTGAEYWTKVVEVKRPYICFVCNGMLFLPFKGHCEERMVRHKCIMKLYSVDARLTVGVNIYLLHQSGIRSLIT